MSEPVDLSLYMKASCPFCQRVMSVISSLGIDIDIRDKVLHTPYEEELVVATGSPMVPCLRYTQDGTEQWMHESSDIIEFLEEHFA